MRQNDGSEESYEDPLRRKGLDVQPTIQQIEKTLEDTHLRKGRYYPEMFTILHANENLSSKFHITES